MAYAISSTVSVSFAKSSPYTLSTADLASFRGAVASWCSSLSLQFTPTAAARRALLQATAMVSANIDVLEVFQALSFEASAVEVLLIVLVM